MLLIENVMAQGRSVYRWAPPANTSAFTSRCSYLTMLHITSEGTHLPEVSFRRMCKHFVRHTKSCIGTALLELARDSTMILLLAGVGKRRCRT